jgi:hypothetical protein
MKTGIELIAQERNEQVEKHGFSLEKDAEFYKKNELPDAAMYALTLEREHYPATWDFWFHDKMRDKERRLSDQEFWLERLKIAGALIAAEIDRIQSMEG